MQRALNQHGANLEVDGAFGRLTKVALQWYLRVPQDGVIGPATVRALQRSVGATQNGIWGPDTTRRLQIALNAGRFLLGVGVSTPPSGPTASGPTASGASPGGPSDPAAAGWPNTGLGRTV